MQGLRTLSILDVEGLHLLATCHVNYKGFRVVAQSIIPGILNNTDQSSLTEYGSVDEGKSIHANEEVRAHSSSPSKFHEMMLKVCGHLSIAQSKVRDQQDQEHSIAGSTEVKGIRGTDKRKYLLDLIGLTPRDANFLGEENSSCRLRPELVIIYQRTKQLEHANEGIKRWEEKEAAEAASDTGIICNY